MASFQFFFCFAPFLKFGIFFSEDTSWLFFYHSSKHHFIKVVLQKIDKGKVNFRFLPHFFSFHLPCIFKNGKGSCFGFSWCMQTFFFTQLILAFCQNRFWSAEVSFNVFRWVFFLLTNGFSLLSECLGYLNSWSKMPSPPLKRPPSNFRSKTIQLKINNCGFRTWKRK